MSRPLSLPLSWSPPAQHASDPGKSREGISLPSIVLAVMQISEIPGVGFVAGGTSNNLQV